MPTVNDLLHRKKPNLVITRPEQMVVEAARMMRDQNVGATVVVDAEGAVAGIFTERDAIRKIIVEGRDPSATPLSAVMSSPVACCKPSTTLEECGRVMALERIRHLPIVEDGRLLGMVSSRDILARQMQIQQTTVEYLHDYLHGKR